MDWNRAIVRNEIALSRIVGALFALLVSARLAGSGLMIPRHVWRSIFIILRPAEAAVRRLIIIAARGCACASLTLRQRAANASPSDVQHRSDAFPMAPAFVLFDPLKRFDVGEDEETFSEAGGGQFHSEIDDTPVDATSLHNRLRALRHALADLAKQAERLARFNARRDARLKAGKPTRLSPTRPGLPPGWHERGKHEVDQVLKECHRLVRYLHDTS